MVIVVLCMVIMLSVLLLAFNQESRANFDAVEEFKKSAQALNCARAGLSIATAAVRDSADARFDQSQQRLFSGENPVILDQGQCLITVSGESGKLNVNLLKDRSGKLNRMMIEQLLRVIDRLNEQRDDDSIVDYGIVPAIIDWIDSDDEVTSLPFITYKNVGAESGYYDQPGLGYKCRNAPVETVEELLPVKGMSAETLDRLRESLTVYGDGKININTASRLVLESLSEKMDSALAQVIIDRRRLKPFESIAELRELPGMTAGLYSEISGILTVDPADRYYKVTSRGDVEDVARTVSAILRINEETRRVEVVFYKELRG